VTTVGHWVRGFAGFWWDFIVGDDWRVAVGVVVAIVTAGLFAHHGVNAWWFLPLAVLALLGLSLSRAARDARNS
jgi:hypothetical protein